MKLTYDFHLHSCLSPCGDDESTPADIVGMAAVLGIEAIALTDHNTCKNCRAFMRAGEFYGLLTVPGMELTTAEEVHVVCLLPTVEDAEAFSAHIYERLPNIKNRPERFGNQIIYNENQEIAGIEEKYLVSATDIGIYEVPVLIAAYGGIAFPAHINRSSFSLLSNLGLWDYSMGFAFAERTKDADMEKLPKIPYLINSDAHRLEAMCESANNVEISQKLPKSVIDALKKI